MTRPMILAIALSSMLAGPASAQHVSSNPGGCAQFYPNANWVIKGENNVTNGWAKLEMR